MKFYIQLLILNLVVISASCNTETTSQNDTNHLIMYQFYDIDFQYPQKIKKRTISTLDSHSGSKSIVVTKNKTGFDVILHDVKKGYQLIVSVWRKDKTEKSKLIVSANNTLLLSANKPIQKDSLWSKLQIKHLFNNNFDSIHIYVSALDAADSTYFDDMEIFLFPKNYDHENQIASYFCNVDDDKQIKGSAISDKEAFSQKKSLLLTPHNPYGFTHKFTNVNQDEFYEISVWRKSANNNGVLVISGNDSKILYIAQKQPVETKQNGWERLEILVDIPPLIQDLSIYCWNNSQDSVYFDDFSIKRYKKRIYPLYINQDKLRLYFSKKAMQKFEKKRYNAFKKGVLMNNKKWSKGFLSDGKHLFTIKARLKGDWLDHLKGQKWSFRIKIKNDNAFNRLKVFSIQNPATRYFLQEYVTHQWMQQADVLTTRYGFKPLYLNDKSLGIYAWEEHFTKQLIEYNLRREGPIMKFDEAPFWQIQAHYATTKNWIDLPYYDASRIIAFGMSKILRKPVLTAEFNIAQALMYQYKYGKNNVETIFDLDKLARYRAMVDIANGTHGKGWHNQRFYYNPILCKLEPINYDDYTEHYDTNKTVELDVLSIDSTNSINPDKITFYYLFKSKAFLTRYISYLEKYSRPDSIENFINTHKAEWKQIEQLLQQEFPDYHFDETYLLKNAQDIRKQIPILKAKIDSGFFDSYQFSVKPIHSGNALIDNMFLKYINAYYSPTTSQKARLNIENYNSFSIIPYGVADERKKMLTTFKSPNKCSEFKNNKEGHQTINDIPYLNKAKYLAFKIQDSTTIYYVTLSRWEKNTSLSPYQELLKQNRYDKIALFTQKSDTLIVEGHHTLSEKIIIPAGHIVVFKPGSELNIIDSGAFISYAPVIAQGTAQKPIKIWSSDSSANGFTILQANGQNRFTHTIFSNLSTLSYKGWTLTGAVTFYETNVECSHCVFTNNHCEDALNIVRSKFNITYSNFNTIYADAFDADFSSGYVYNCQFKNINNDAIDFSTSQIDIENCQIDHIKDKGISGGEASTLKVKNTIIKHCNIGVASKDLSHVYLTHTDIQHCSYGLVALTKKAEYGPAQLTCRQTTLSDCKNDFLIEKKSLLLLNGKKIDGNKDNVYQLFYGSNTQ